MEVLVLDGKNYVKASKAARDLGYATDYVGQLCRSGKVDAHLIGRTWYVNQDELGTHRVEKKRMSRIKAREHAKRSIEEHRKKTLETKNNYRNIDIQYEEDHKELIPETRKLTVASIPYKNQNQYIEESPDTYIENEGEKIVLSGELNVIDVTDGLQETDTVILTPSKIRKGPKEVKEKVYDSSETTVNPENQEDTQEISNEDISDDSGTEKILSFSEKLQLQDSETDVEVVSTDPGTLVAPMTPSEVKKVSNIPALVLLFILLLLTIATLPLSLQLEYSPEYPNHLKKSYLFSITEVIQIIPNKI